MWEGLARPLMLCPGALATPGPPAASEFSAPPLPIQHFSCGLTADFCLVRFFPSSQGRLVDRMRPQPARQHPVTLPITCICTRPVAVDWSGFSWRFPRPSLSCAATWGSGGKAGPEPGLAWPRRVSSGLPAPGRRALHGFPAKTPVGSFSVNHPLAGEGEFTEKLAMEPCSHYLGSEPQLWAEQRLWDCLPRAGTMDPWLSSLGFRAYSASQAFGPSQGSKSQSQGWMARPPLKQELRLESPPYSRHLCPKVVNGGMLSGRIQCS